MRLLTIGAMQQQKLIRPAAGMTLWLDANQITGLADNDPVAQWNDLSGNNYHATQADPITQPIYKTNIVNGRPVLRFSAHTLATPAINIAQPNIVFIVMSCADSLSRLAFTFDGIDSTARNAIYSNTTNRMILFAGENIISLINRQPHPFSHLIFRCTFNGASSSLRRNRGDLIVSGNAGTQALGGLTIGSRFEASSGDWFYLNGDIAEIIVYDSITAEGIITVENYLAGKYNITLT